MTRFEITHASAVSLDGAGVLVKGPSGCGKSSLALQLIGLGAVLVSDDRVILTEDGADVVAEAPPALAGLIEARGVGLLRCPHEAARIRLVVDLGQAETERLPPIRHSLLMNQSLPLVLGPVSAHLAPTICLLLRGGRLDPETAFEPASR
ncbi:HPr kinase/phosphorylase [Paracoccus aerodenitrificans]|uniref:HPr kinase/phosphorylase n=1 Tax=Paracoccus aerodenitrificans TaxID=3017781 RepID=UPI0022F00BBA|nr:HPr kinase/phosphatase C-terminal domain-containing protein [Paracoccus aerodenitrificans]WBU63403.1 HPr kinase/phosphatase C-terminal domain-containing protein [Paracoccus aerodenitrificans]